MRFLLSIPREYKRVARETRWIESNKIVVWTNLSVDITKKKKKSRFKLILSLRRPGNSFALVRLNELGEKSVDIVWRKFQVPHSIRQELGEQRGMHFRARTSRGETRNNATVKYFGKVDNARRECFRISAAGGISVNFAFSVINSRSWLEKSTIRNIVRAHRDVESPYPLAAIIYGFSANSFIWPDNFDYSVQVFRKFKSIPRIQSYWPTRACFARIKFNV